VTKKVCPDWLPLALEFVPWLPLAELLPLLDPMLLEDPLFELFIPELFEADSLFCRLPVSLTCCPTCEERSWDPLT
jgi:hypothetical protein